MKEHNDKKKDVLQKPDSEERQRVKTRDQEKSTSHSTNIEPLADLLGQLQKIHGNKYVQRVVTEMEEIKGITIEKQGSENIDSLTKEEMESAFGEDFSDVQIHNDSQAQEAADKLDAQAFTQGRDIYFSKGEYNPSTRKGKELLSHELTHVIQQRGSSSSQREHGKFISPTDDSLEQEAGLAAEKILTGHHPHITTRTDVPALQRLEKKETPSIKSHPNVIAPPGKGIINAGKFFVAYFYNIVPGADVVPLTLGIPAGVSVGVIPLTSGVAGNYSINDPGGTGARAVTISVSYHLKKLPKLQVTLTQGSFTYIVVFQFPQSMPTQATEEKKEEGGKE